MVDLDEFDTPEPDKMDRAIAEGGSVMGRSYCLHCEGSPHECLCVDCADDHYDAATKRERKRIVEALIEMSQDKDARNNAQRQLIWAIARDIKEGDI